RLKDVDFGDEEEYAVVGSAEADPTTNKISNESPIGKAVLGQKKGTIIEVNAPAGVLHFQILDISNATSHLSACS
ncbi:MAG: GreA/GreB family elongation factor, partial [Bacillota bacterium]|nr:GreA/GreB family elongation factor [Bacillota bacterium]